MRNLVTICILWIAAIFLYGCDKNKESVSQKIEIGAADGSEWGAFIENYMSGYFALRPDVAVRKGRHEFDGQIPDWSEDGLKAISKYLEDQIKAAKYIDTDNMNKQQIFERDYMIVEAQKRAVLVEYGQ